MAALALPVVGNGAPAAALSLSKLASGELSSAVALLDDDEAGVSGVDDCLQPATTNRFSTPTQAMSTGFNSTILSAGSTVSADAHRPESDSLIQSQARVGNAQLLELRNQAIVGGHIGNGTDAHAIQATATHHVVTHEGL